MCHIMLSIPLIINAYPLDRIFFIDIDKTPGIEIGLLGFVQNAD